MDRFRTAITVSMLVGFCLAGLLISGLLSAGRISAVQNPTAINTLILTNKTRLQALYSTGSVDPLLSQLQQLAGHAVVNGVVLLVDETPAVASAYIAWQDDPTNTELANAVSDAIHGLIEVQSGTYPELEYVVLVGDDRVIPYRRVPDETPRQPESSYKEISDITTVGAALADNMMLTDDFYGDIQITTPISLYEPDLSVGRLVETPTDINHAIGQFLATDGRIQTTSAMVAGYDFNKDTATETCRIFDNANTDASITTTCNLIGDEYSADQFDTQLRTSRAGFVFLYTHSDHYSIGAPTGSVKTDNVVNWTMPTSGRLVYQMGGHDLSVPPEADEPLDWPQAWLSRGAVLVGETGYSWGYLNSIGLSQRLGILFARHLIEGESTASIGDALLQTKRGYVATDADLSAYDRKVVNQLTLYGLPMYRAEVSEPAEPSGALIVLPARLRVDDSIQANIHHVSNAVYRQFFENGYGHDRIQYLATDSTLDATGDGNPDVDSAATLANLQSIITGWAVDKVDTHGYLTIYMIGHGGTDKFYLDKVNDQTVTTADLDDWLRQLENAVPNVRINVIIDQAYAGAAIQEPSTLSKNGRLIIASSGPEQVAYTSASGAQFSDPFIENLGRGTSLYTAFERAKTDTVARFPNQVPELDGNGNAIPNEATDQAIAESRILFPGVDNSTPTATPTVTSTPTSTSTPTNTPVATPTATTTSHAGDAYENDDACNNARSIDSDGRVQHHTFHQQGDKDWLKFDVDANATYQIDVLAPESSPADVQLELFDRCTGEAAPHDALGPGIRLRLKATSDAEYRFRLTNYDLDVYGDDVAYQLSVRKLVDGPVPGALVLVAGRLRVNDHLQPNIHEATDQMYQLFLSHGYPPDRIYYLANDLTLNPDQDANTVDVDALANRDRLEYAITQWATDPTLGLGPDRAFTLYMMDHGNYDTFYLNGRKETVSPDDLNQWLGALETARPGVKVNVIVDACLSGSFIDPDASLSKEGRVVITSASSRTNAYTATGGGTVFTNAFGQGLGRDMSLYDAFSEARQDGMAWPFVQTAWIDDNGNGIANDPDDGVVAQKRGFAFAGSLSSEWDLERPYIPWAEGPQTIENRRGNIRAQVRSASKNLDVWAAIYAPDYTPPPPSEELVQQSDIPTIRLEDVDSDGIFSGTFAGFDQKGAYQIVVYAVDEENLQSRPKRVVFHNGARTFFPVIYR